MPIYNVLLIEDSKAQARVIGGMLSKCGWAVTTAFSLQHAFETVLPSDVDLIISDLHLPDCMDGSTIARIRAYAPDAIIAAISAGGSAGNATSLLARARADGAEFLLKKPFTYERLNEIVSQVQIRKQTGVHIKHVLVVEDSRAMRSICTRMLTELGFRVTACESMDEAFDRIDVLDLDVILTDVNMPGLSPFDAVRELREALPGVAIIAMSGGGEKTAAGGAGSRTLNEMLEAGCDVAIAKPFSPEDLEGAIRRATIMAYAAVLDRVLVVE